jgi:hypothetical protein
MDTNTAKMIESMNYSPKRAKNPASDDLICLENEERDEERFKRFVSYK